MAIRCKDCGKKHGNNLTYCPYCTEPGLDNIEVRFQGDQAIEGKEFLMGMLDDVRQRLPDEDAFKTSGQIFFSSPKEIIERWGTDIRVSQYIETMKHLYEKLKLAAKECGHDPVCFVKILFEDGFPDGISVPDLKSEFFKKKSLRHIGFIIDIVVDPRMMFRKPDYIKGVIAHEIIEFSTKYNVWKEHIDEIKEPEDFTKLIRKYLKSGYFPPSKEYDEHEEIVNKETKRLGFEKEISIMEKLEITTEIFRSPSEVAEIEDWIRKKQK